jgi:stearoyl-CoA desaturase (delta-9 desaturase)
MVAVVRWLDSWADMEALQTDAQAQRIDWARCVPFLLLHAACALVFAVGASGAAVTVAVALFAVRIFAITAFYHRYFSHRSFKTSRPMQFLFALLGSTAVQRGPLWWASHHRHHHRSADQPEDPHSPRQHGLLWSHMGWFMAKVHFAPRLELISDFARFPELRLLDRFDSLVPIVGGVTMFGIGELVSGVAPSLGVTGAQLLVWSIVSTVAVFHTTVTINSLAHRFGRRRYPTPDDSRNNALLAVVTMGEGWHNNHHACPSAVRLGHRWWEIDVGYYVLFLLAQVGLIWDLKPLPARMEDAQ